MKHAQKKNVEHSKTFVNGKKPYHPPRIIYRESLEVIAGVCGDAGVAKEDEVACTGLIIMS